jgi:hypothetical protein
MARTKSTTKPIRTFRFDLGDGDTLLYSREDGYTLLMGGETIGGFATREEAEAERRARRYATLRRAA